MMEYFIGISLPPKEEQLFSYVKAQFHPKGKLTSPPHITLIPPFKDWDEEELLEKLEAGTRGFHPFEINLKKVGTFQQSKKGTVFLEPESDEEIKNIYLALSKIIKTPKRDFVAHLSLAQKVPIGQIETTKQKIEDMKLELKLKIRGVALFKRLVGENWQDFRIIPFASEQVIL